MNENVGEILSTLGRLQAKQQKQVHKFQDEVLERAKRVKEKAHVKQRSPLGLPVKSSATNASLVNSTSTNSSALPSTITGNSNNRDSGPGKDDMVIGISNNL